LNSASSKMAIKNCKVGTTELQSIGLMETQEICWPNLKGTHPVHRITIECFKNLI